MQNFDDILQAELAKPVTLKNGNGATILPMEAMVKSVINAAMKGDRSAVNYVRTLTRTADPATEMAERERTASRRENLFHELTEQLRAERLYDGQDAEIRVVAEIAFALERLDDLIAQPDFQFVTTDYKSGHQSVSPLIALRDKQRETFQKEMSRLRQEAMQRIVTKARLKI